MVKYTYIVRLNQFTIQMFIKGKDGINYGTKNRFITE